MDFLQCISIFLILTFGIQCQYSQNDFTRCMEASLDLQSINQSLKQCQSRIHAWSRLSTSLEPVHYFFTMAPFLHVPYGPPPAAKLAHFRGHMSVLMLAHLPHRVITLHVGPNLHWESLPVPLEQAVTLQEYGGGGQAIVVQRVLIAEPHKHWLVVVLSRPLSRGRLYHLTLPPYRSEFMPNQTGLYLQRYSDNGTAKLGASTLLNPLYAKLVFPCLDDPVFESRISLRVLHRVEDGWVSQSIASLHRTQPLSSVGTLLIAENDDGGWVEDVFEPTPPMQIYQFTFTINQFVRTSHLKANGLQINIWAPKEDIKFTKFCEESVSAAIDFFTDYFNNAYPFKKLDVVNVMTMPPYESGSSTYGLLLLKTNIMMISSEAIPRDKQIALHIINHEISHQWIGNNFRTEWFDALWIVEGMAGYMEQKFGSRDKTEMQEMATGMRQTQMGLFMDETIISHKLNVYPYNSPDAELFFDDLIFAKGFSMIRMIERVLGHARFQMVMQKLMNDKSKKPFTARGIWSYMDDAVREAVSVDEKVPSIRYIMSYWQEQAGYPILTVRRHRRDLMEVRQHGNYPSNRRFLWPVPVTYLTSTGDNASDHKSILWMEEAQMTMRLPHNLPYSGWIVLNHNMTGYLRVNYDYQGWRTLIRQLRRDHVKLPGLARLQLLDDHYFFFRTIQPVAASLMFEHLCYLEEEEHPIIWRLATTIINMFYGIAYDTPHNSPMTAFLRRLTKKTYLKVQWMAVKGKIENFNNEDRDVIVISNACQYGNKDCLRKSLKYTKAFLETKTMTLPNHLYQSLLCHGIAQLDEGQWNAMFNLQKNEDDSDTVRYMALRSLTCARDISSIQRLWTYLENGTNSNDSFVKPASSYLLMALGSNPHSRPVFLYNLCTVSVTLTLEYTFLYQATIAALNKMDLPDDCSALKEIYKQRKKRTSGGNLEIETGLVTLRDRRKIQSYYLRHFRTWLASA